MSETRRVSGPQLIGHWPLGGDLIDQVGRTVLVGEVNFGRPDPSDPRVGAMFTGHGAGLALDAVPHWCESEDFTISVKIWTPDRLTGALGDVFSDYDQADRYRMGLALLNFSGVTTSQPNQRTVAFGVDTGAQPEVTDRGRPGSTFFVTSLVVFEGSLYSATVEGGADLRGRVFRWDGDDRWQDCGSPDGANAVTAMTVFDGALHVGTSRYQKVGSALPDSSNTEPGGLVHRYLGGTAWESLGRLDPDGSFAVDTDRDPRRTSMCDSVGGLVVHDGDLYGFPLYSEGLFRFDRRRGWVPCGSPGVRLMSVASHDGELVCAGNEGGRIWRTDGRGHWEALPELPADVTQSYAFAHYAGALHVGTWPDGKVHALTGPEGARRWRDTGRLGSELEVMAVVPYNGALYAGTLPRGEVYRMEGSDASADRWALVEQLDATPDVKYRRVWSMAVHRGELFAGTLPSGRVHSIRTGQVVTADHELRPGWREITVVRERGTLILYVDRRRVATSATVDQTNGGPGGSIRVGAGPHGTFTGAIADLKLHRGAVHPIPADLP